MFTHLHVKLVASWPNLVSKNIKKTRNGPKCLQRNYLCRSPLRPRDSRLKPDPTPVDHGSHLVELSTMERSFGFMSP